jgi:hypothetical protein
MPNATERAAPTRRPILALARHQTEDSATLPHEASIEQAEVAQASRLLELASDGADGGGPPRWRARGRRLCPVRRPRWSAALAEASAELGSIEAVYARMNARLAERRAFTRALARRRRRDFDAGLYALDGHLTSDAAFRRFVAERPGLRLPTPEEAAVSWPEPEEEGRG